MGDRMKGAFASRDFRVLLAGMAPSMFGDWAMILVFGVWVKELTDSNAAAGMVIFALLAPSLVAPLLGFLVDRSRRKPFMVWTNLAAALMVLPLLLVRGPDQVWLIYAVAVGYGLFMVLHTAAMNGLLKELLPASQLGDANGALQTIKQFMRLTAPLAGAGLYAAFGGGSVAIINAVSFCLAAGAISLLKVREVTPERGGESLGREITAGIRFLRHDPLLSRVVPSMGATLLFVGAIEPAYFALVDEGLGRPPSFLGVLLSIEGGGAVLGGICAAALLRRICAVRLLALGVAALAIGFGLVLPATMISVVAGSVILGCGLPWLMVGYATMLQRRTPAHLMARVSSAGDVVLGTPQTLSIAVGASLIAIVDYRWLLAAAFVAMLVCWAYLTFGAPSRSGDEPPPVDLVPAESAERRRELHVGGHGRDHVGGEVVHPAAP